MLITASDDLAGSGRYAITLPGLPTFNASDPAFAVERFESWDAGPAPQAVMVANGGGPGAVAVGPWLATESYYVLSGSIDADPSAHRALKQLLKAAVTPDTEASVQVEDPSGVVLQVFARLYDRRTIESLGDAITFSLPLVAPDPFRYGLTELTAEAGGFAPSDWFRTYLEDAGDYYRTYSPEGAVHYRQYEQDEEADAASLPPVASLSSEGDAESRRMTIEVAGPTVAGEWWVEDADGTRLWSTVSLAEGQSVSYDCRTGTAWLDGSNIDHLTFGDFPVLRPGANAFRLVVGTVGGSYMTVTALPAYL